MATDPVSKKNDHAPEGSFNTKTAAALFGGAVVATAGAYFGARAVARRNRARNEEPVNSVMATAITAYDVSPEPVLTVEPVIPAAQKP